MLLSLSTVSKRLGGGKNIYLHGAPTREGVRPPDQVGINSSPVLPGLCQEGIYQRQGDPERAAQLLEEFTTDARNVKLRESEHRLEDVTDALQSFFSQVEDALLAKELYPYWVSALGTKKPQSEVLFRVLTL